MQNFVAHIEREKNGIKEQMNLKYPERDIEGAFASLKQRGIPKEDIKCVHVAGFKLPIPDTGKKSVLFKRYTPTIWVNKQGQVWDISQGYDNRVQKPGSGGWDKDYIHFGTFHRWGEETFEQDNGHNTQDSFAIVELPDGTIEKVVPDKLKFI